MPGGGGVARRFPRAAVSRGRRDVSPRQGTRNEHAKMGGVARETRPREGRLARAPEEAPSAPTGVSRRHRPAGRGTPRAARACAQTCGPGGDRRNMPSASSARVRPPTFGSRMTTRSRKLFKKSCFGQVERHRGFNFYSSSQKCGACENVFCRLDEHAWKLCFLWDYVLSNAQAEILCIDEKTRPRETRARLGRTTTTARLLLPVSRDRACRDRPPKNRGFAGRTLGIGSTPAPRFRATRFGVTWVFPLP